MLFPRLFTYIQSSKLVPTLRNPKEPKEAFGSLWNPKEPYVFEELHCKTALQKCPSPPPPPSPPLQSALEREAKAFRAQK